MSVAISADPEGMTNGSMNEVRHWIEVEMRASQASPPKCHGLYHLAKLLMYFVSDSSSLSEDNSSTHTVRLRTNELAYTTGSEHSLAYAGCYANAGYSLYLVLCLCKNEH